ncbi:MAG TPA: element excision factor XisI family protein [Nostocaceae cyanobacterium]|nr:element excision factor XisI family protein [Nostocaceae cyanobacterium]
MTIMNYSELIQTVLAKYTETHLSDRTEIQLIFDNQRNHYLVIHIIIDKNPIIIL